MSEPTPPAASSTIEYYRPTPAWAPPAPRQRYWLHVVLLLLTCFTTLVVGARMQFNFLNNESVFSLDDSSAPFFPVGWAVSPPSTPPVCAAAYTGRCGRV